MAINKISLVLFVTLLQFQYLCNAQPPPSDGNSPAWRPALPGWNYKFPADHFLHPEFKTEWWYFTGNLQDAQGHSYGYELTFFRQGVLPPKEFSRVVNGGSPPNRFVQGDFKFAHFAISDLAAGKFHFVQKINRGAFKESGFAAPAPQVAEGQPLRSDLGALAWMENWSLRPQDDGSWQISAASNGGDPMSIDLRVSPVKPPVIEGTDGVSQKAEGAGNASHYYSFTRLQTTGTLSVGANAPKLAVHGDSWFDHEWASNQLAEGQVGWDWFCFQFNDGTELMLYAMRRKDGSVDPFSSGTWIAADGHSEHLRRDDFRLQPQRRWKSEKTGAAYPLEWRVSIPSRQLEFTLKPRLDAQELVLPPLSYWEGAIAVEGQRAGKSIQGLGYMELTGYAAAMTGLRSGQAQSPR